jgi:PAS domain S-box-containing protein
MSTPLRILILEDNEADAGLLEARLREGKLEFTATRVQTGAAFAKALDAAPPDLILADYSLPSFSGEDALEIVRKRNLSAPFILVSGTIGDEVVAQLLKEGATDFVAKLRLEKLVPAVKRALAESAVREQHQVAEVSLRESEARFRAVFDGVGTGIALEDLQGRIIDTNRALQHMLGYSAAELRAITRRDFTHSHDHREESTQFKRLLTGKTEHYQAEKRFVRKDGRIFWGQLNVSIVRDATGQPRFPLVLIEDISERQRAEEAYMQYAAIVEFSNDAIISMTFDGVIFSWNPAAERLYGYSAREANGHSAGIIVPPNQEEEFARVVERIKRGENIDSFETTRLRKDGSVLHVSLTASAIKDVSGRIIGVSTISRDITERKLAEETLRRSEENFRKLVEYSPDAIFINCEDKFVYLNSAAFKLFGAKKPEQIIGRTILDFVHPDCRGAVKERIGALRAGQSVVPLMELKYIRVDSSVVNVESTAIPFEYGGKPAIQVIARDVRERKLAEEALRKSELENQKLAAFAQFNPNPIIELDAGGKVNYENEAARQMAKSLGKTRPAEIMPRETGDIVRECIATGKARLRHEIILQHRTLAWSFFPIPSVGVVHCYATDITERLNLEAQLRQAQKMESIGQLAGGVAHDFNNILTVIQGHTSLLTMHKLPVEANESAQQIGVAAERAANLTRQLLTFSRRQIIQPRNLDLNEVVNNMTKMLRRLLGEDITLQVNYASSLPFVNADPGMMEQILLNLSVNARDAMPKGGRLFVNTSVVKMDEALARQIPSAAAGDYVCLTVKDTGRGIPPEVLPRIFEPFFTTKDVGKGTGLGLATVYGIVQQHHGWIDVTSKPDKETVFQVFLPAVAPQIKSRSAPSPEPEIRGGKETILVVEDETPLRVLVRSVLQRYGYKVLEADSGVDALPVWEEHRDQISLLLTDMVMPKGVSGRELAERLRGEKPDLKVIYSSGYSLAVVGSDMVLQEGLNFLQKPYHPRKLAQAVRDCLDG